MNFEDIPTYETDDNEIDQLKIDLEEFCTEYGITKFESEDIVELLEDGEKVEWIVEQLMGDNPDIDEDSLTSLLSDIQAIVGPEEEYEELDEETKDKPLPEEETLAEETTDLSEIDFSQLGDLPMPDGMQLPPGFDMKQLQKMMDTPQGKFMADFSLFCQEKGADMTAILSDQQQQQALNEEWMNTPRETFDGKTPAQMLEEDPTLMPQKVETYRREEPRVGRNDPCPCGSGKKYKKCCGRNA